MTYEEFISGWDQLQANFRAGARDADPGLYFDKFEHLTPNKWQIIISSALAVLPNRSNPWYFPTPIELEELAKNAYTERVQNRDQEEEEFWLEAARKFKALPEDKKKLLRDQSDRRFRQIYEQACRIVDGQPSAEYRRNLREWAEIHTYIERHKNELDNHKNIIPSYLQFHDDMIKALEKASLSGYAKKNPDHISHAVKKEPKQ